VNLYEAMAVLIYFASGSSKDKLTSTSRLRHTSACSLLTLPCSTGLFKFFDFDDGGSITADELKEVIYHCCNGLAKVMGAAGVEQDFVESLTAATFIAADSDGR
jgi:hypothetical protein